MNKKLEWLIIIFMLVILVTLGSRDASADHVAPYQTDEEYQAEITKEMEAMDDELSDRGDSISNLQGVANAVVCVFAPDECEAKKDLAQTENTKE